jgi:O-antigen ligase/tetratricopeptide (TPR) repeat protein
VLKRQRIPKSQRRPLEEDEEDSPPSKSILPVAPTPWWALLLMVAVPLLAISICGNRSPFGIGLTTVLAGAAIFAAPPRFRVPVWVGAPLLLMLGFALCGLLPVGDANLPAWRTTLRDAFGIIMPGTQSPQPWITLQGVLMLAVGILWLSACITRGFDEPERRTLLQVLVLGIAGIAIASLVVHYGDYEVIFWQGTERIDYYGPFTNRNNFSGLLASGAVLAFACTYDAYHRKRWSWPVFALAILPMFGAILANTSRMGVVLFFAGLGMWMMSGTHASRSAKRFAVSTSLLLILATVFLIYGQRILQRFTGSEGIVSTLSSDGRINIFQQSLALIPQAPFIGVGLGNFEPVYALHKTASSEGMITRTAHPESDWLWLGIEGGLLALAAALTAGYFIWRGFGKWKKSDGSGRRDRRLRAAAGIGVALLFFQGFVDTPLHTLGLTTFGALLAGLAWHPGKRLLANLSVPILRYTACGFCLFCGFAWLVVGSGEAVLPGTFSAKMQLESAKTLSSARNEADAIEALNKVISTQPLRWDAYYMRAAISLQLGRPQQQVMDDFSRARALEPNSPTFCMQEAFIWMEHSPLQSLPALREAIRRDPRNAADYYRQIADNIHRFPDLREPLRSMAEDPKLRLLYLERVSGSDFQVALRELLDRHPSLDNFTPTQKLSLFELWYGRGDKNQLIRELQHNPNWSTSGWIVLGRHWAGEGKFRDACELGFKHMRQPSLPTTSEGRDLGQLTRGFLQNPADSLRGLSLYQVQRQQGLDTEAFTTLRDVTRIPNAPASALYEYAVRLAEQGDYSRAWDSLLAYRTRSAEP